MESLASVDFWDEDVRRFVAIDADPLDDLPAHGIRHGTARLEPTEGVVDDIAREYRA